ncbi:MAG: CRISPR-associated endonuclease Cas2 [Chloroflexi bacterium]|nr:CRISPR-associated endonuclease Cas2 [Chloroflexota bacterium]
MLVVITYDVNTESEGGQKRLRKVAKACESYGQRVQNSVFECLIDTGQMRTLQARLEKIIDKEKDSLRYYFLGNNWENRVLHIGAKKVTSMDDVLIL